MNAEAFDEYVSRAENAEFRLRVSAVSSRSLRVVERSMFVSIGFI